MLNIPKAIVAPTAIEKSEISQLNPWHSSIPSINMTGRLKSSNSNRRSLDSKAVALIARFMLSKQY